MKPITRPDLRRLIHNIFGKRKDANAFEQFLVFYFEDIYLKLGGEKGLDTLITKLVIYKFEPDGIEIMKALRDMDPDEFDRAYDEITRPAPPAKQQAQLPAPKAHSSEEDPVPVVGVRDRDEALEYMRNAHALVIGVANYQYLNGLGNPVNDATDVASTLIDKEMCGYPKGHVRLLRDSEATKDRIEEELKALAKATDQNSTVFIFFAGHGGRIETGPNAGNFLLPVDTKGRKRFNEEEYLKSAISSARFSKLLRDIPANKLIVALDCCYSGGVASLNERERDAEIERAEDEGIASAPSDKMLDELLASGKGRVIIAATNQTETAKELVSDRNGLFTKYLLQGLRGAGRGAGLFVTVFELYEYVHSCVSAIKLRSSQTPILKADMESPKFYLAVRSVKYVK